METPEPSRAGRKRDHRIIRSRHFHKLQRRHFLLFDVLPFVGTLVALGLLLYRPIGALELCLFFGLWLVTGLGLTVGYHRLFTHQAFSLSRLAAEDRAEDALVHLLPPFDFVECQRKDFPRRSTSAAS